MQIRRPVSAVSVFSTQFITTLSAFAYVLSESIENAQISIYSHRHPSFKLHSDLIARYLVPWCQSKGYSCKLLFVDDIREQTPPTDLLITPRIDHRLSIAFINQLKPSVVVETGESIGVEPKLYSFKTRLLRRQILQRLQTQPFLANIILAHIVSVAGCDLRLLRAFLRICSEIKGPLAAGERTPESLVAPYGEELVLLLLPYLTHPRDKKLIPRVFHRLRSRLGIRSKPERYFPHVAIRQAAKAIVRQGRLNGRRSPTTIYLKPHPKNQKQADIICNSLIRCLKSPSLYTVLSVSADVPLEQLVAGLAATEEFPKLKILGFGTNLLAAKIFLHPSPVTIALAGNVRPRFTRFFWDSFDFFFHRTEFLRRRHVSRLLESLDNGLNTIRLQESPIVKST